MSYWIDIRGQTDLFIYSEKVPRIGERIVIAHDSFLGQDGELRFRVVDVVYDIVGQRLIKEMPVVVVEPSR
jgi:hypothetical protein